jgi:iron complex outermembrane receptor protein
MLYVQVMNLTDTQYQEILGAPMPGRWVMGGVKVDL